MSLYLATIAYVRQLPSGGCKRVKEQVLIGACAYADAEARVTQYATSISPDVSISSITLPRIADFIRQDDDDEDFRYYRVKASLITLDEASGLARRSPISALVRASSVSQALSRFEKAMVCTSDIEVSAVTETAIVDYIDD